MTGDVTYRDLYGQLEKFLNTQGVKELESLCMKMSMDLHPTLQQRFTQLCATWFNRLAEDEATSINNDERNRASLFLGREFRKTFGEVRLPVR